MRHESALMEVLNEILTNCSFFRIYNFDRILLQINETHISRFTFCHLNEH